MQALLDAGADVADYAAQPQTPNLLLSDIPMIDYAYNERYLGEIDNYLVQRQLGNNPPRLRMHTISADTKVIDSNEDKDAKVACERGVLTPAGATTRHIRTPRRGHHQVN